jgi:hypothetical protein
MRRASARLAGAGSVAGVLWLTLTVAGCPLREKEIRISETGIGWLLNACTPPRGSLPPPPPGGGGPGSGGSGGFGGSGGSGAGGSFPPPPGGSSDPNGPCVLNDRYPPSLGRSTEARLFLVSPADRRVQDASKCMSLHPCSDGGRFGPIPDCMASDLNQQLDGAMPNGLGFDGLKKPEEEAHLILAFYQPADASEEGGGCHRADLFACAGLATPLGGGAYDISCASCKEGSRTAPGNNNGPCPKDLTQRTSCFLQLCDSLLADNGFD